MSKVLIIVEGIADVIFLRDYIKFLKSNCVVKNENLKKNKYLLIEIDDIEIKILIGGGYTALNKLSSRIQEYIDSGYKVAVIQDADDITKENGTKANRMEYLDSVKEKSNIDFKTFLFPNHNDDGDLETLLLKIQDTIQYNLADKCYINYIECCSKISHQDYSDELSTDKSKVFNYFRTYYGMQSAKEENRMYEIKYWDFNHIALDELKKFLGEYL